MARSCQTQASPLERESPPPQYRHDAGCSPCRQCCPDSLRLGQSDSLEPLGAPPAACGKLHHVVGIIAVPRIFQSSRSCRGMQLLLVVEIVLMLASCGASRSADGPCWRMRRLVPLLMPLKKSFTEGSFGMLVKHRYTSMRAMRKCSRLTVWGMACALSNSHARGSRAQVCLSLMRSSWSI